MTTETYAPMDISSLLDSEETIAEYLTAATEDENPDVLLLALADVAKARGMARVAKDAGLGRESLYKTLAPGSHPRFETIQAVMRALGVRVAVRGRETTKAEPRIDAFRGPSSKEGTKPVTIDAFVPKLKPSSMTVGPKPPRTTMHAKARSKQPKVFAARKRSK